MPLQWRARQLITSDAGMYTCAATQTTAHNLLPVRPTVSLHMQPNEVHRILCEWPAVSVHPSHCYEHQSDHCAERAAVCARWMTLMGRLSPRSLAMCVIAAPHTAVRTCTKCTRPLCCTSPTTRTCLAACAAAAPHTAVRTCTAFSHPLICALATHALSPWGHAPVLPLPHLKPLFHSLPDALGPNVVQFLSGFSLRCPPLPARAPLPLL